MPKNITLNSTEVTNVAVQKLSSATGVDMNGLECIVYYTLIDNNGNKVMTSMSKKFTMFACLLRFRPSVSSVFLTF